MPAYAVEAENLGKRYRLYSRPHQRLLELLTGGRWSGSRELWALRNLDLALAPGMVLGVCGANGSGKSTLLRLLAGTTSPSEGRFRIRGRVNGLLDLGVGFDFQLSGRTNLLHQAVILGYNRRSMAHKIDEIVDFAELGSFIDEPLRTYSAGMGMRLGFSVAALLDPDVLILDEIFAVGDIAFQKKCVDKIHEFKNRNKTILFCSHNIYELRQLCDQAIWLRDGRLFAQGDVVSVTGEYFTHVRENTARPAPGFGTPNDPDGTAPDLPRIQDVRYYRMGTDEEIDQARSGESIEVRVWWEKPAVIGHDLHLGIGFIREDNIVCAGISTHFDGLRLEGERGCMGLRLPSFQLLAGRYLVVACLLDQTGTQRFHEYVAPRRLVIPASTPHLGVFVPDHAWSARPAGPAG